MELKKFNAFTLTNQETSQSGCGNKVFRVSRRSLKERGDFRFISVEKNGPCICTTTSSKSKLWTVAENYITNENPKKEKKKLRTGLTTFRPEIVRLTSSLPMSNAWIAKRLFAFGSYKNVIVC